MFIERPDHHCGDEFVEFCKHDFVRYYVLTFAVSLVVVSHYSLPAVVFATHQWTIVKALIFVFVLT